MRCLPAAVLKKLYKLWFAVAAFVKSGITGYSYCVKNNNQKN